MAKERVILLILYRKQDIILKILILNLTSVEYKYKILRGYLTGLISINLINSGM